MFRSKKLAIVTAGAVAALALGSFAFSQPSRTAAA